MWLTTSAPVHSFLKWTPSTLKHAFTRSTLLSGMELVNATWNRGYIWSRQHVTVVTSSQGNMEPWLHLVKATWNPGYIWSRQHVTVVTSGHGNMEPWLHLVKATWNRGYIWSRQHVTVVTSGQGNM